MTRRTANPARPPQGRPGGPIGRTLVALGAALILGLTACTSAATPDGQSEPALGTPAFSGPWASEFAAAYDRATDDFTRSVIEDGVVSEQERAEMIDRFTRCVADLGYGVDEYALDGSFHLTFAPDTDADAAYEEVKGCSRSSGETEIGALSSWTHRNPERADETTLVVECLARSGVVPTSYSTSDYANDVPRDEYPFAEEDAGREALQRCRVDPVGVGS
ncbi:hypothetical protein MT356_06620 [Rathayibacter festucae]|uniref:hypothetical protein n=1 Tax=Rathayibacter festucae TaxID=110937 RepID=UPI001FB253AC|nr:hypothetical protein [Rathayibacter festucae]MCJ1699388.1 hypothetical protein [Rathayibacter festucae]